MTNAVVSIGTGQRMKARALALTIFVLESYRMGEAIRLDEPACACVAAPGRPWRRHQTIDAMVAREEADL